MISEPCLNAALKAGGERGRLECNGLLHCGCGLTSYDAIALNRVRDTKKDLSE